VQNKKPPDSDFTESDRAALQHAREELQEHEHRAWLWASMGRIAKWTLAVIAGVTVLTDAAIRLWKSIP
jgi:hypothetical protein